MDIGPAPSGQTICPNANGQYPSGQYAYDNPNANNGSNDARRHRGDDASNGRRRGQNQNQNNDGDVDHGHR